MVHVKRITKQFWGKNLNFKMHILVPIQIFVKLFQNPFVYKFF